MDFDDSFFEDDDDSEKKEEKKKTVDKYFAKICEPEVCPSHDKMIRKISYTYL